MGIFSFFREKKEAVDDLSKGVDYAEALQKKAEMLGRQRGTARKYFLMTEGISAAIVASIMLFRYSKFIAIFSVIGVIILLEVICRLVMRVYRFQENRLKMKAGIQGQLITAQAQRMLDDAKVDKVQKVLKKAQLLSPRQVNDDTEQEVSTPEPQSPVTAVKEVVVKTKQKRNWMDRIVDAVIGVGPQDCYALICMNCGEHNGLYSREASTKFPFTCRQCNAQNEFEKGKSRIIGEESDDEVINEDIE